MSEIIAIDVSSYNGKIDWTQVKMFGVEYAILRCATQYDLDKQFIENYDGAKAVGIKVGVYKFSYSISVDQAKTEAVDFINLLGGRPLDLPVFYDMEWSAQNALNKESITDIAVEFCNVIKNSTPYKSGIYCNTDWYYNKLDISRLIDEDFWITHYAQNDGEYDIVRKPDMDMSGWQYTSKGKLSGIPTSVNLSVFYKDYGTSHHNIGWDKMPDGTLKLYLGSYNCVSNGWYKYEDDWYWFDQSGTMVTNLWYRYKDHWYYIKENGKMVKAIQNDDGKWYYMNDDNPTDPIALTPDLNDAIRYPGIVRDY